MITRDNSVFNCFTTVARIAADLGVFRAGKTAVDDFRPLAGRIHRIIIARIVSNQHDQMPHSGKPAVHNHRLALVEGGVQFSQGAVFGGSVAHAQAARRGLLVNKGLYTAGGLSDRSTPFSRNFVRRNIICAIVLEHHRNTGILAGTRRINAIAELVKVGHAFDVSSGGYPSAK